MRFLKLVSVVSLGFGLFLFQACLRKPAQNVSLDSIKVTPIQGSAVADLARHSKGAVTVVNLWASWCEPCREEFPGLVQFQKEWAPKGVQLYFVSADFPSELKDVKKFLAENNVNFETYIKSGDDQKFLPDLDKNWNGALPTTFIYDSKGEILRRIDGGISKEALDKVVLAFLKTSKDQESNRKQ